MTFQARALHQQSDIAESRSRSPEMNMHSRFLVATPTAPAALLPQLQATWVTYANNRPEYEKRYVQQQNVIYCKLKLGDWNMPKSGEQMLTMDEQSMTRAHRKTDRINETSADRCGELYDAILLKARPSTLRDLAAIATVSACSNPRLWSKAADDLDWDELTHRKLIEAVLMLAGERNVVADHPQPKQLGASGFQRFAQECEN